MKVHLLVYLWVVACAFTPLVSPTESDVMPPSRDSPASTSSPSSADSHSVSEGGECAPGCKYVFIGDSHCDKECFVEGCDWDKGDCDSSCKHEETSNVVQFLLHKISPNCSELAFHSGSLHRMIVMGPYYKEVDHLEYQAVGLAGQKRSISMEEGRKWEGIDAGSEDDTNDWQRALADL